LNEVEKVNAIKVDSQIEVKERNLGTPQITEFYYKNGQIRIVVERIGANDGERHILALNPQEVLEAIKWKTKGHYTLPNGDGNLYA